MGRRARKDPRAHADAAHARERAPGRSGFVHSVAARAAAKARLTPAAAGFRLTQKEHAMDEDAFNLSIRKFLKMVGVSSQREIEQAVAKARAGGAIKGNEKFPASVTLEIPGLKLSVRFDGKIELE